MNHAQRTGIVLGVVGLFLILSKLVGVAYGQQIVIGLAFIVAGGVVYGVAGRSK